jgi:hypothetical protein
VRRWCAMICVFFPEFAPFIAQIWCWCAREWCCLPGRAPDLR